MDNPEGAIDLTCPECRHFLGSARDVGRFICASCGAEIVYKSKRERRRSIETTDHTRSIERTVVTPVT